VDADKIKNVVKKKQIQNMMMHFNSQTCKFTIHLTQLTTTHPKFEMRISSTKSTKILESTRAILAMLISINFEINRQISIIISQIEFCTYSGMEFI
jgi:hypothetical protein